jgi:LAS superfamily LD-carboxypeptidase LdcB
MTILTPEQLTGRASNHVALVGPEGLRLHPGAAQALNALAAEAAAYDIELAATSGFRDFGRQLAIWNGKFSGQRPLLGARGEALDVGQMEEEGIVRAILTWSALPGASRHHWGSELDVYDKAALAPGAQPQLLPSEYARDGVFARLADFLRTAAARHGFFLPYDRDRGGVAPEPWHLSYAPVSGVALPALTLDVLREALRGVQLGGMAVVQRLLPEIHERYVCRVATPPASALTPAARPS